MTDQEKNDFMELMESKRVFNEAKENVAARFNCTSFSHILMRYACHEGLLKAIFDECLEEFVKLMQAKRRE